jgi:hypothetical protein
VLSLSVLFTAIFSAASISIFHGIVILARVGLAHAPYDPILIPA